MPCPPLPPANTPRPSAQPASAADLLRARSQAAPAAQPIASLWEVFCETAADAAGTGFALAHLDPSRGPVLWITDRVTRKEAGLPCLAGLPAGLDVLRVDVSRPVDVLWAAEQGLDCTALCGIVAELWGDPPALDFTATKRLALRAEAHGVPCWLLRRAATPALSAARERWRIGSLPSGRAEWDARAPGQPHWRVELFRSRFRPPGSWVARYDAAAHSLQMEHPMALGGAPNGTEAAAARA